MKKDLYVISDIHGRGDEFEVLLNKHWDKLKKSKLILLGDYIGYGRQNLKVISLIEKISKELDVVVLKGNWEDMLYTTIKKNTSTDANDIAKINAFKGRGGNFVLKELKNKPNSLESFLSLIETMEPCYFDKENMILFTHAGVDFGKLRLCHGNLNLFIELQEEEDLIWDFDFYPTVCENISIIAQMPFSIVTGHTPIQLLDPNCTDKCFSLVDKVFCVDFGASRKSGNLGLVNILSSNKTTYIEKIK